MNRQGFAPIIILLIVAGMLVIGGGIWYYKAHPPAASLNQQQSESSTSSAATTAGPMVCAANDIHCLAAAAQNCSQASVEWTQTSTVQNVFNQTTQINLAIKGLDATGRCSFSARMDSVDLSLTTQEEQQAKAAGNSDARIQQLLQGATTLARQQSVGAVISCSFASNNLVQILNDFGTANLTSDNCTKTSPAGTSVPLPTGTSPAPTGEQSTSSPISISPASTWRTYSDSQVGMTIPYPPNSSLSATFYIAGSRTITILSSQLRVTINVSPASRYSVSGQAAIYEGQLQSYPTYSTTTASIAGYPTQVISAGDSSLEHVAYVFAAGSRIFDIDTAYAGSLAKADLDKMIGGITMIGQ
ncbi:MAG: hypothetical protein KGJ89_04680 [Patescibacteria group bacterium]|nr:hypothetical protein [Patescibacteria group bacterium]MDE2015584.1 hypothetical protein [Patescibacteria group bacterium]MDE2227220.1 hypothetical protein [Patescibacteria group bacterium]